MDRLRVAGLVVFAVLVVAEIAAAQSTVTPFTGMVGGHLGVAHGGDVPDGRVTPVFSMAVVEEDGLGAELDVAHTTGVDRGRFSESRVTSVMLNVIAMLPRRTTRPFLTAGAGALHVGVRDAFDNRRVSRTDFGMNAGGGLLVMFDETFGVRGDVRYFRHFERHDDLTSSGFFDFWRTSIGVTVSWPIR